MNRRDFLLHAALTASGFTLFGCGREDNVGSRRFSAVGSTVTMYDTYAMALYMDGGLGPKTGILKVDYVLANQPVTLEFWHGHGGKNHAFTLTPAHFDELKQLKKIYVETTTVADHKHRLFIDPKDPKYRVPGAMPVLVPVDGERA